MSLYEEMARDYIDGNLLACPSPVAVDVQQGSDNGPMYSSEELVMLIEEKAHPQILETVLGHITRCINSSTGLLQRFPVETGTGWQIGPDDYYGVLNALKKMGRTAEARGFLKAVWRYKGALNNVTPGVWTQESFLVRQGQMIAAMVATAFPSMWNPLHWLVRLLAFPFFLWASVTIAVSCIGLHTGATDERRLSWHLGQTVKGTSLLCWLAYKLWTRRLWKDYPPISADIGGMRSVASIYYHGVPGTHHPFVYHWPLS